jgi:hypothetical protein
MQIQPDRAADAGTAALIGHAGTFPAQSAASVTASPYLAAAAPASSAPGEVGAEEAIASALAGLKLALSRLAAEKGALAGKVEELSELNRQAAAELARVREEQARERDEALARAEAGAVELRKVIEERDGLRGEVTSLVAERKELLARVARLEQEKAARDSEQRAASDKASAAVVAGELPQPERVAEAFETASAEPISLTPGREARRQEEAAQQGPAVEFPEAPQFLNHLPPFPEPIPDAITEPAAPAHDFPSFAGIGDDLFFGSADADQIPTFVPEPRLQGIEYGTPEEVVALYHPVNVTNVSLDGKGQEICQGYICCIRQGDRTRIYAAILGVKSGRIRVFVPEEQPADEDAVVLALRGAMAFGEQIGLQMEEKPARSAGQHQESVLRCPVLRCSGTG